MTITLGSSERAHSRPRLLFLCQNLPYPPHGGAAIRSYHTLRLLSRTFDVTGFFFYRRSITQGAAAMAVAEEGLSAFCDVQTFPIPQEVSRLRRVADHLSSVALSEVYTRYVYRSDAFSRQVTTAIRSGRYDLAHVDSLDLSRYLRVLEEMPVGLAHHNVESQLLARRARTEGGLKGMYLDLQARLMRAEERQWCPRVALNVVVSDEDRDVLQAIAPKGRFEVIPNGVDTKAFTPSQVEVEPDTLVFVGGYTWFPNRDGMHYFAEAILPLIRERRPTVRVVWVGRAPDSVRTAFASHGIEMTGYVEDIRDFVGPATCFVVPLRVGGGTRLKILDAWALGKAVVSTPQGAEGLAVREGDNISIADDPESFAAAVLRVLRSASFRSRLEEQGRATAVETYDWDVIGESMTRAYRALLASPPSSETT